MYRKNNKGVFYMSTFPKLLVLFIAISFLAVQAHAFKSSAAPAAEATSSASMTSYKGKVVETKDASGYTYLHLENDSQNYWAAIPATKVMVGDEVELVGGNEMKNFPSKSLGRTFESIIFAQGLIKQ
jgi:hypothetical protein